MRRGFLNEKLLSILLSIIIDVDYAEDLKRMWEIFEFVGFA